MRGHIYPTMGRERSGFFTSSQRKATDFGSGLTYYIDKQLECNKKPPKASSFSPEEIEALKRMSKEQIARVLFKKSENPDWR